jgi:hypothetical protein
MKPAGGADVHLIIYEPVNADLKAFIEFWKARHTGYDDDLSGTSIVLLVGARGSKDR